MLSWRDHAELLPVLQNCCVHMTEVKDMICHGLSSWHFSDQACGIQCMQGSLFLVSGVESR